MESCITPLCRHSAFLTAFVFLIIAFLIIVWLTHKHVKEFLDKLSESNDVSNQEMHKLIFSGGILISLGAIFVLAMLMYYFGTTSDTSAGDKIFEATKTIIPPIITMILGYYFGASKTKNTEFSGLEKQQTSKASEGNKND